MITTIIVDADSCPVKQDIIEIGQKYGCNIVMVASFDHELRQLESQLVQTIQVDRSDQSADLYIANIIRSNHVLITQDFGLATIGLAKKAIVISNRGQQFTDRTIDYLLERRHEQAKKRRGGKHTKGPRPFTNEDRAFFRHTLTKVLESMQENENE